MSDGTKAGRIQVLLAYLLHFGNHGFCDRLLFDAVAGANACFGETLIGSTDEDQPFFSGGVLSIEHSQRIAAFMAVDKPFEQKIIGSAAGFGSAANHQLYLIEDFLTDQRFVGSFHDNPVVRCLVQTFL